MCVCVSVYPYSHSMDYDAAYGRLYKASPLQPLKTKNGDFSEMGAFELEKLAVSQTKLPGPTH